MRRWRSPEELAEIGLSRNRVLMVNEAHDGLKRCIRTRNIGTRMIEPAHAAGVRHLAMEALTPDFAAAANRDRRLGPGSGYLAQSDLRDLMNAALDHGWSLIAYVAQYTADDPRLLSAQNDREEQQACSLTAALGRLPRGDKLLVWCGMSHHYKGSAWTWEGKLEFMGSRFQRSARIDPFCIDQCPAITIRWNVPGWESWHVLRHRRVLEGFGGTAGYLLGKTFGPLARLRRPVDAVVESLHNELE